MNVLKLNQTKVMILMPRQQKGKVIKVSIDSKMESVTIDDKSALDPVVVLSRPGRYKCSFHCGYSTNQSNDRPRHQATCDLNPDKQFGCSKCKLFITGKLNYEQHVIIAHTRQPVSHRGKG